MGSAKEKKEAVVERGGQGLSARSGDSKSRGSCWNCGKESHRMETSGSRGPQEGSNRPLVSLVVRSLGSSSLPTKVSNKGRARHPMRVERVHSRARVPLRPRSPFSRAMGNKKVYTSVPPWCHRFHRYLPRDDSLWRLGRPFQRGVPYKLMRLPGFGLKVWLLLRKRNDVWPIHLSPEL